MSEMQFWEVTTRIGVTVEKCDTEGGPLLKQGDLLFFSVGGETQAFFALNENFVSAGRITEEEYNTFREVAREGTDAPVDDSSNDVSYREYLEGHI